MKHRIFLAINLPENVKEELAEYQKQWPDLPVRWTKKINLHITVEFLGYLSDEEILEVCKIAKETAKKHSSFPINLIKTCLGPPGKAPKMIWVLGNKSEEFTSLKNSLQKAMVESGRMRFLPENRTFSPHITLGRINSWAFKEIEPDERPSVEEDINLKTEATSIDVMESVLKRGGPIYSILESCPLKK